MNSISDRELLENRDRVEQLRFTASVVGELIARNQIELVLGSDAAWKMIRELAEERCFQALAGNPECSGRQRSHGPGMLCGNRKNHLCVGGAGGRLRQAARLLSAALDGGGVPWYHFPVPGKKL